ncbi:MAG: hypothetical protein ACYDC1_20400 [Limisphaerales bacterium]
MSSPARVRSIEAIDAFRARLVVYVSQANRLLDDIHDDTVRTRAWLETDRQPHWVRQIRQRTRWLEQAQQELLTARLANTTEALQNRRMVVTRARQAVQDAEEHLGTVHSWLRRYESEIDSRRKVLGHFRQVLSHDMTRAIAFLDGALSALEAYAETPPPPTTVAAKAKTAPTDRPAEPTGFPSKGESTGKP